MAVFKGKIPETVRFHYVDSDGIYRQPGKGAFKVTWDEIGWNETEYNTDFKATETVRQSVDVLNDGRAAPSEGSTKSFPNEVMTELKVVGIDSHRTVDNKFAVLLPNGFVVKVSQDVVMDAMLNVGIEKDGVINGEFVWGKVPGGMKLIRVDSGIHRAILDYQNRDKKDRINVKTMIPGQLYKTAENNYAIFCGFINTMTARVRLHPEDKELVSGRRNYYKERHSGARFDVLFTKAKLATLWYEVYLWNDKEFNKAKREAVQKEMFGNYGLYHFKAIKKHQYVEQVGKSKVDIPADIIMRVRKKAAKNFADLITEEKKWFNDTNNDRYRRGYKNGQYVSWPPYQGANYKLAKELRKRSSMVCMVPFGMESIKDDALGAFDDHLASKDNHISKAIEAAKKKKKKK